MPPKTLRTSPSTACRWSMLNGSNGDTLSARLDRRQDYGEVRVIGFADVGLRLFCVVFTDRGDERRVISLRKANAREVADYANT